ATSGADGGGSYSGVTTVVPEQVAVVGAAPDVFQARVVAAAAAASAALRGGVVTAASAAGPPSPSFSTLHRRSSSTARSQPATEARVAGAAMVSRVVPEERVAPVEFPCRAPGAAAMAAPAGMAGVEAA